VKLRVALLSVLLLLLLLPFLALGQNETVPTNGDFLIDLSGWGWSSGVSWGSDGYGSAGRARVNYQEFLFMYPVTLYGGSHLTFWARNANAGQGIVITVYDFALVASSVTQACFFSNVPSSWTSYDCDLSSYSNHSIAVLFETGNGMDISAVRVSNAANTAAVGAAYINGRFDSSAYRWAYGGTSGGWSSTVGNPAGSFYVPNGRFASGLFVIPCSTMTLDYRNSYSNPLYIWLVRYDGSVWQNIVNVQTVGDNVFHQIVTTDLTPYCGGVGLLWSQYGNSSLYIDNVCPASGCLGADPPTPTPSPTLTSTPAGYGTPYGYGTPVPVVATIDWSAFPTYPPFPTFPAFPTSLYGLNTPVPVTGSVSITGAVKIDDSTPVRVKVDDSTPVRVTFGDYAYTPVHYQNIPIARSTLPSGSGGIPTLISHPSQSSIQYGQTGGSSDNPVRLDLASEQWSFTLPGIPSISDPLTVVMDYYYPAAFVVAGLDMLPALYSLGGVFVIVFVIQRIKNR
jgi:hypothetical protein